MKQILIILAFFIVGCSSHGYAVTQDADGRLHCKDVQTGQYVDDAKCN